MISDNATVALKPLPYRLQFDPAAVADLNRRITATRWPDEAPAAAWSYGSSVAYVQELLNYWRDQFDWSKAEQTLNQFDQYKVPLNGVDLHFIHQHGVGPKPMPLLLSHGWPGSVVEFNRIIPMLTDPARFGGDAADAFTVVAPSLPGYTLSFTPGQPRFSAEHIADIFAQLMRDVLGYPRFAAQGGDWGSFITSRIGFAYPQLVHGIHLNFLALRRDPSALDLSSPEQEKYAAELTHFLKEETGYQAIQGTKPQTLAFGLNDSPAGLAAWLVEKFRAWSDCDGRIENAISRDDLLTNISLYWMTGAIGSSFWPYYARMHGPWPVPAGQKVNVATGYAAFPKEILRPPRALAEQMYNITHWREYPKGGHFAALEQAAVLAQDIRNFFRPMR